MCHLSKLSPMCTGKATDRGKQRIRSCFKKHCKLIFFSPAEIYGGFLPTPKTGVKNHEYVGTYLLYLHYVFLKYVNYLRLLQYLYRYVLIAKGPFIGPNLGARTQILISVSELRVYLKRTVSNGVSQPGNLALQLMSRERIAVEGGRIEVNLRPTYLRICP